MAEVHTLNGQDGTSPEGMYFHAFSGRPIDQYEWPHGDDPRLNIGDTFVLEVRVELTKVITDEVKDGTRQSLGFKVVDSKPGRLVAKSDGKDPNQTSIDDLDDAPPPATDYGDYEPAGPDFSG